MANPTNGELSLMLKNLDKSVSDLSDSNALEHKELINHQKETNGRVNRLEKTKYMAIGAIIILNIIVVPLIINYFAK